MNERALLDRLHALLVASHAPLGQSVEPIIAEDLTDEVEVYPCGQTGVIAFIGDYALTGWAPHDRPAAPRDAYRRLHERLKRRGFTRHMVYPLNFPSVRLTRKLGAVPVGVDADGFMHYILTLEAFEAAAAQHLHREEHDRG